MKFHIPFSYTVNATTAIEAKDLAEAIEKAEHLAGFDQDGTCRLLNGCATILRSKADIGSITIDSDHAERLNPKQRYKVKLVRTQVVEVEVEAHNEDEAEYAAIEGAEDGSLDDFSDCIREEIEASDIELVD
jgi:hypothetical protein